MMWLAVRTEQSAAGREPFPARASKSGSVTSGANTGGADRPRLHRDRGEPAVGRRLHSRRDMGRHRL